MGRRSTRTVMFTDVVGSTRLRTTFGDDAVDELLARHDRIVGAAAAAHDGQVVKGTGDGSLVVFASARAGVSAAVAMQQGFAASTVPDDVGPALSVRVALHSGEVREADGDVLGEAVNAAARILGYADGGEIVVSRVVRDLLGTSEVDLVDRGEHALRGFVEPQQLFTVQWPRDLPLAPLDIRLLGTPSVSRNGRAVDGLSSTRLLRLLAALVLEREQPVPRARLAAQLWPGSTGDQARTNLRRLLRDLRQVVPDLESYVATEPRFLRWRTDAPGSVDLVDFQEALALGDDQRAVEVYGGDLLPDLDEDWLRDARAHLRRAAADALERVGVDAERRGDDAEVIDSGVARLGLDPYWEPAYQRLMRAHSRLGNRAEALRLYHRLAELTERELGTEPDPATRQVYDEVRGGTRRERDADTPTAFSTSLVGRDAELAALATAWDRSSSGRAHLVLVTGEAGIGKSRLVDEFARAAAPADAVVRARAYESAGRLPWGPVVEWLRSAPVSAGMQALATGWLHSLAVILPELRAESDGAVPVVGATSDADRTQLFDAIVQALVDRRPRLLLLDDLQWCDTDTLELIGYLISSHREAAILVMGTVRTDEVGDDHPLTRLISGLGRIDAVTELPLTPLDAVATADLARQLTRDELPAELGERLWRETEGNPLFLVEAARAGFTAGPGSVLPLTPTIKATIASRLRRLGADARSVAEAAAAIGREFTVELVVAASDLDESRVLDALDELWRRRIISERGASYDFTHDKVREVAYEGVGPVRRRRLHRSIAAALSTAAGTGPGPLSAVIAMHLEAAGELAEAVDAHSRAAQHASAVFGLDEAISSCRRGLRLIDQLPPGPERDERELGLLLVLSGPTASREGYGSAATVEVFERSLTLSERLHRPADPVTLRGLGLAAITRCRFDRSQRFGEELLAFSHDPIAITEGHYLLGVTAYWRGRLATSESELRAAIASYDPALGPVHRAYFAQDPKAVCTARLGLTMLWLGDEPAARQLAADARELATAVDHPMTLGYVLVYTAMIATELDDIEWLRRDASDEGRLGSHHLGFLKLVEALYDAWLAVLEGHDGAMDSLEAAVAQSRLEHQSLHLTYGLSLLARAHLRGAAFDLGLAAVGEGIEWGRAHDQRYAESLLRRIEGELLEARGDLDAAARSYEAAVEVARLQGARRLHDLAAERLERLRTRR